MTAAPLPGHVLALCGGVGGAKLARGLAALLPPASLTLVVNTGDDFSHLGLAISPDLDTVLYTLAGLADRERGWGLQGESWQFMSALKALGGEHWFQLGDRDLATHVERTRRLAAGESLSQATAALCAALGVRHAVVPMSDQPVRTWIDTDAGPLAFQHYFVRERCAPVARSIRFEGADRARPSPAFAEALQRPDLAAVIVCPSNPYLSIDPILALPGVRQALAQLQVPRLVVSPVIAGDAVKGPTAKLMREFGHAPGVLPLAWHYQRLVDALLIDDQDAAWTAALQALRLSVHCTDIVMRDDAGKARLAGEALAFAHRLRAAPR